MQNVTARFRSSIINLGHEVLTILYYDNSNYAKWEIPFPSYVPDRILTGGKYSLPSINSTIRPVMLGLAGSKDRKFDPEFLTGIFA